MRTQRDPLEQVSRQDIPAIATHFASGRACICAGSCVSERIWTSQARQALSRLLTNHALLPRQVRRLLVDNNLVDASDLKKMEKVRCC